MNWLFAIFGPRVWLVLGLTVCAGSAMASHGPGGHRLQKFERSPLTIVAAGGRHDFTVEVARSQRQQTQGLMFRRRLAPDAGMLFIYRRVQPVSMWMRNTLIPLDMLFIAADGRIAHIAQRTVPLSLETISSGGPVAAVLELNAGTVSRLAIRTGDRVETPAFGR